MKGKSKSKEIEYCESTIYPLLKANKWLQNVIYRHGSEEYGKDITFSYLNPLSTLINCGVQVKYGDISGRSNRLITNLINQIPIAFSVPYKDIPLEGDKYINELYVICSGKYTNNAIEVIKNQLRQNIYNIVFWNGENVSRLKNSILMAKENETIEIRRLLTSVIIEIRHNLDKAKTINENTDKYIAEKRHFLGNYRTNCLENLLSSSIDDWSILEQAMTSWDNLDMSNNLLSEVRIHGNAEHKRELQRKTGEIISFSDTLEGSITQYLLKFNKNE